MPVINGIYLKDFPALPGSVADANIIPIAIAGNQVAYRTTVAGIITDARITSKLLTGLSVTGTTISATDTILEAFGKVQNQLNNRVSSVGLTMPSAFSVANSPITGSGTLAVTAAGNAAQYIRGDGVLATLPSGASGGSSVNYYLNGSVDASVATYKQMSNSAVIGAGTDFALSGNGLIAQFLTDLGNPNRLLIPGGAWNLEFYFSVSSVGGSCKFYIDLLKYNGSTFTLIASGSTNPEEITGGTLTDLYVSSLAVPETVLLATDRLAIRVYIVDNSGGRTVTLHTEDNTLCQIITTFPGGLSALNGLTANTQYFATGTTGTDFAISSSTDTHTFNLPTASSSNRGALSSTDWTTFNNKQNALTNPVTGTGTTNYLPKFTGTTTIGNSSLFNDSNGNIGLNVTPQSVWLSSRRVLEVYAGGGYAGTSDGLLELWGNSYVDGSGNVKYLNTGEVGLYQIGRGTSGVSHIWHVAASGTAGTTASTSIAMKLFSNANFQLGNTSDAGYLLDVQGTGRFTGALTGTTASFSGIVIGGGVSPFSSASSGTNQSISRVGSNTGNSVDIGVLNNAGAGFTGAVANYGIVNFGIGGHIITGGTIRYTVDGSGNHDFKTGTVTFGSTLSNGTYTYTLPSATGTLALTSALGSYLPLAGGTLTGALTGTTASFTTTGSTFGAGANSNFQLNINGFVNKAARISFQQSGVDKWLLGNGAASENNKFELYNAAGTVVWSVDNSTNVTTFGAGISGTSATFSGDIIAGTTINNGYRANIVAPFTSGLSGLRVEVGEFNQTGLFIYNTNASSGSAVLSRFFSAAGAEVNILGNGNVGIGTTSPSDILDVQKNQNATTQFYFRNTDVTDANSRAYLNIIAGTSSLVLAVLNGGDTYIAGTSGKDMYFQQNIGGSVNMMIKSTGNLLINTTTDAGYKLDVNGTGRFTGSLSGTSATFSDNVISSNANSLTFVQLLNSSAGGKIWTLASAGASNVHSVPTGSFYLRNSSDNTTPFQIASTGAATFSTSITNPLYNITGSTLGSASARWVGSDGGANGLFLNAPTGGNVYLGINNSNVVNVQSTGVTVTGSITATAFYESSSVAGKNIMQTNPLTNINPDVIQYTRKTDESKDIRYGYSAEQIHSLMPELTDKDVTAVKYIDVHTLLIAQLQQEIKELKAKLN